MTITQTALRASILTAISTVTEKIANGQTITEYREDGLSVKRESPAALLAELNRMLLSIPDDDDTPRRARVATFEGAA